jgi:hypothetical protein
VIGDRLVDPRLEQGGIVGPHHFALKRRSSQLDCPQNEAEQDGGLEAVDATLAGAVVSASPRSSSRNGRAERALLWVI